jgi:hypothetical protein
MTLTLSASAVGAIAKPVIAEIISFAKQRISSPERLVAKALSSLELGKQIYNVINIKTLWNIETEVSVFGFYYPSRILFPGEESPRGGGERTILGRNNIVIQGTAGQGKSIYLRHLYGTIAFSIDKDGKIPLFIELRRVDSGKNLANLIVAELERIGLPKAEELGDTYFESGKFILLLDGFDELGFELIPTTCDDIERLATRFPDLQIIATSRPDSAIQKSAHFRVAKLDPLRRNDHLPFLEQVCATKVQALEIHNAISDNRHEIGGLLTTPLLMTLLVLLYRVQSAIPTTLSRFYEQLFDVLFLKHDQTKPGFHRNRFTNLDEFALKKLFEAFAFNTQVSGKQLLSTHDFEKHLTEAIEMSGISVSPSAFKKELIKTACLLLEDGTEIAFIHKSVAEFYAASFIQKAPPAFGKSFYEQINEGESFSAWRGELSFLQEIDSYKFNLYFYIPQLKATLDHLSPALPAANSGVVTMQLQKVHLTLGRAVGRTEIVGISKFGAIPSSFFAEKIVSAIVEPLFRFANTMDFYDFRRTYIDYSNRQQVDSGEIEGVPLWQLDEFSEGKIAKGMHDNLNALVATLHAEYNRARDEVALEDRKSLVMPKLRLKPLNSSRE